MRTMFWSAGALVAIAAAVFACSSSNGNSSCLQAQANMSGPNCYSCLQSSCSTQVSNLETSCSNYLSCVCPGGNYSASAAQSTSCQMDTSQSGCVAADQAVSDCFTTSCASQCSGDGGSGSGSGSGSSSGGSSSNTACLESQANLSGPQCYACAQNSCGAQLSGVENACGAYISCSCPGGVYSQTASQSQACQTDLEQTSCQSADQAFSQCLTSSCESQCSGGG